ncbi:cytochrome c oxidase subunit 6B2 isoform X1 [Nycticebus coucang]|uniref:cytochrome c oxidase subunit 6B2 isoform X1 n=1 Tax=Nycticebus coucang TaxID=9470 RepID=UPI00234D2929|nr:cytochrome c oxidase subunit 6B2 isoform X1 [Nycticebus coucang]
MLMPRSPPWENGQRHPSTLASPTRTRPVTATRTSWVRPGGPVRREQDYHRCVKAMNRRGKSTEPCAYYFRVYRSLCPISWVQRWNEQIKEGTFAGKI